MDLFFTKVAYASVDTFIAKVDTSIVNPLIILLFTVALAYFLYGLFEFVMNAENDEKKTVGKSHMLWGIIGLTIMMGVWAILGIILSTLNISKDQINPEQGAVHLPDYNPSTTTP